MIRNLILAVAAWFVVTGPLQAETLRIGVASFPPGAGNPLSSSARTSWYPWRALFDTLTLLGEDMRPVPSIALSWEPLAPTRWRLSLRPGVVFSNGEKLDAEAVAFSLLFLKSDAAIRFSVSREADDIVDVIVVDPLTIDIITSFPIATFPNRLTAIPLLPPDYWTDVGPDAFAQRPIGSGAFKLDEWNSTRLNMTANRTSWRAPVLERIDLLSLPETSSRVQALVSGQTDIASEIAPDDVERLVAAGFEIYQRPSTSLASLTFNVEKGHTAFKDVRVRQALNYAVNKQAILDVILGGMTRAATQHTPFINPAYDASLEMYPYDPERARTLLADAGYPDGFTFVHEFAMGALGAHVTAIYQQVAADLARVGVKMTIRPIPWPQLVRGVLQGEWNGDSFGFEYETLPTGETLRPFRLHSCSWAFPWYCDPEIEPVMQEAKSTFDESDRIALLRRVLKRYHDQAPNILLFEQVGLDGVSPEVVGYSQVNGLIPYDTVTVER